ncbi:hypothetical protein [Parafilimonas sp.]
MLQAAVRLLSPVEPIPDTGSLPSTADTLGNKIATVTNKITKNLCYEFI